YSEGMHPPPIDKLTYDCLLHFYTKLDHNDVDVLCAVDRKFYSMADTARSKARLMNGKELKIVHNPYVDKIYASVFIENDCDADMETEFYHTQSKHKNCQQCEDLNGKDFFNTPDVERTFKFVKWWTTRYLFNKVTLCFKELQMDDILLLMKDNVPLPNKYPIEYLDISLSLGQSNRISEFQAWIVFMRPQNLRLCVIGLKSSNLELAGIDFLNKLALSAVQEKESSLEVKHSSYAHVTIEASPSLYCNFLLIYNNFSCDIIRFSADLILAYTVERFQKKKPGKWEVTTTRKINILDIVDAMAVPMESRRAEGKQMDHEYQVFEGGKKIFSINCNYILEDIARVPHEYSSYGFTNTIRFY
ncbi:hypothetical protein PRIPAC_97259, partial [Pristionchus pacificus]|uniref:Uncharacterized protein n=1 Tax=Pristionchus pacificus TaxID=54126 RepID=A0A2A6CUE4_PRIPA